MAREAVKKLDRKTRVYLYLQKEEPSGPHVLTQNEIEDWIDELAIATYTWPLAQALKKFEEMSEKGLLKKRLGIYCMNWNFMEGRVRPLRVEDDNDGYIIHAPGS